MRPAIFLAAAIAAVAGCQATRSPAAEPVSLIYNPPVKRAFFSTPIGVAAAVPVQLVSDTRPAPARFPLARGVIDCFRVRCPNPCPRLVAPTPAVADSSDDKPADVVGPDANTPADARDDTLLVTVAGFIAATAVGFLATARGNRATSF